MSCAFKQNNNANGAKSLEYEPSLSMSSSSGVSASELSYMKAQVWTLEHHLRQEKQMVENLTESFKSLANEKYELLQELTRTKQLCHQLNDELEQERENSAVLTNEIECLQEEADKHRVILEKAVTQKVELKESIVRANDTIQQMGLMYLKLKDFKD